MMNLNFVVIVAGGMGTRFWPQSKVNKPKQFLDVLGLGRTLLQSTFDRYAKIVPVENIHVITVAEYKDIVINQLPEVHEDNIFIEPERKNTAPCIVYSCYKIGIKHPDANILIAPADHLILNEDRFFNTINNSFSFASKNNVLITIGIKPTRPATGYGYIQYIESENEFKEVKTFTEKPNEELAKTFLQSGDFLWNAGIFIWNFKSLQENLELYVNDVYALFELIKDDINTKKEPQSISNVYSRLQNISIDYALLEKSKMVRVIPADFEWSDLGTWNSVYEQKEKDYLGNAVNGSNVRIYNASNNLIAVPENKLVIVEGLDDFIIVDTNETLMILKKNNEQEVKTFTTDLKRDKLDQYL
jgi:mannose-1-phosphate guanylyltransferase